MSVCKCPAVGLDGVYSPEQKQAVAEFLNSLAPDGVLAKSDWNLLSLNDMANAGNDLKTISSTIPFRGGPCPRTVRCCGMCTRQCQHRCVQDCLHRLYMWKKLVESTPPADRDKLPLSLRLIVTQKFESHAHLSWVVGEVLARKTNAKLKEYMENASLRPEENPYKVDYAPQVAIGADGKRLVDKSTGEIKYVEWPASGLCPYCLPSVTVDGRFVKQRRV